MRRPNLIVILGFLTLDLIHCQRLAQSVKPVHYDVVLLPVIASDDPRLCGHVFIDFVSSSRTNIVTLNGLNLEIVESSINSNETGRLTRVEELCFLGNREKSTRDSVMHHYDEKRQQISFIFKEPFESGKKYRLSVLYKAKIYDEPKGFFRASYKQPGTCCQRYSCFKYFTLETEFIAGIISWFGGTQMETTHARRVLPCFDEPAFKTTFRVTVGHQTRSTALSNTLEASSRQMYAFT